MANNRPWGPDVSHYQGHVDWVKVKGAGASFAGVKVSEGSRGVDSEFKQNWPAIFKAGIMVRLAYHYGHIEGDPRVEAAHYVATVRDAGGFHRGDFAVLDAEDVCPASSHVSKQAAGLWAAVWLDEVVRLTGLPRRRVLVYTGAWWWGPRTGYDARPAEAGHPLWLAAYTQESQLNHAPWGTWRFWQYTNGTKPQVWTPGVGKCDQNVFNGTKHGLWWMSGRPLRSFR
jgi:GH25 family lysozyme M1 (1,4-beta-N-acetylmuramidase)